MYATTKGSKGNSGSTGRGGDVKGGKGKPLVVFDAALVSGWKRKGREGGGEEGGVYIYVCVWTDVM